MIPNKVKEIEGSYDRQRPKETWRTEGENLYFEFSQKMNNYTNGV